jgi:putative ABC transport system ATP-binding protein
MTANPVPLIETRNLTKTYHPKKGPSVTALDDVNLTVLRGEFLAIVGRSGSGKTTLLNLIGALDRPSSGEVFFEGKKLSSFSRSQLALFRRQNIGFVFQIFNLLPALTVFENVELALMHSHLTRNEISEKVGSLLNVFDLTGKSDRLPLELSVGQQQKAAVARALANDPLVILADEPTGEMDPISGREILNNLIELNKKSKFTLVVATHGVFPRNLADRTFFLNAGRIVSQEDSGY